MLRALAEHRSNRPLQTRLTTASEISSGGTAVGQAMLAVKQISLYVVSIACLLIAVVTLALAQEREQANQRPGSANLYASSTLEVTASGFDLSTLPTIESIDAQTDITVFLQRGVPDELRPAALRRAWIVTPAIRDFKGLAETDWDFNDPNSIPGFGVIGPDVDVSSMVAQILGRPPRLALAR